MYVGISNPLKFSVQMIFYFSNYLYLFSNPGVCEITLPHLKKSPTDVVVGVTAATRWTTIGF